MGADEYRGRFWISLHGFDNSPLGAAGVCHQDSRRGAFRDAANVLCDPIHGRANHNDVGLGHAFNKVCCRMVDRPLGARRFKRPEVATHANHPTGEPTIPNRQTDRSADQSDTHDGNRTQTLQGDSLVTAGDHDPRSLLFAETPSYPLGMLKTSPRRSINQKHHESTIADRFGSRMSFARTTIARRPDERGTLDCHGRGELP
jgi:hypothetical protein